MSAFRISLILILFRDDDKRLVGLPEGVGIIPANTRLQIGISTNIENTSNVNFSFTSFSLFSRLICSIPATH